MADKVDWNRAIGQTDSQAQALVEDPVGWRSFPIRSSMARRTRIFDHSNCRQCALQSPLGKREFATVTADSYERDDPEWSNYIALNSLARRASRAKPHRP